MAPPAVSIIISTQFENPDQLLAIAEDFCFRQTQGNWELVFVVQVATQEQEVEAQIFFDKFVSSDRVRFFCFKEKGLARSRNRGIQRAQGDVILLGDTDCRYPPDAIRKIQETYRKYPELGLITFQALDWESGFPVKRYWGGARGHNSFSVMRVGSWEITFRREEVLKRGVLFDERFGLGSHWPSGEENIFMCDFLKNGGHGGFAPEVVVYTVPSNDQKMDCTVNSSKGALLRRVWGVGGAVFGIPYLVRRYRGGLLQDSLLKSISCLYRGWWRFPKTPSPEALENPGEG